ncbi:MAG: gliding motility-associated C-terminal domain-containing protein [Crocinitomicaceae bacterium]
MKKLIAILILMSGVSFGSFAQDIAKIPNAITPNNDGINDVLVIRTVGVEALAVTIYNRYGSVVYRYFGLNGTWDGHNHAGEPCVDGVYFVVAECTMPDGSKAVIDQHVTLLR